MYHCEYCNVQLSHERTSFQDFPEYNVCSKCGVLICDGCTRYKFDGVDPYCKECCCILDILQNR